MQEQLAKKTLNRIERKNIKPLPRWYFLLRNYFFWAAIGLACILLALSAGLILHIIFQDRIYGAETVFLAARPYCPYFWIAAVALLAVFLPFAVKKTKEGYKYELWFLAAITVLLTIVLTLFIFWLEVPQAVHQFFTPLIQSYERRIAHLRPNG